MAFFARNDDANSGSSMSSSSSGSSSGGVVGPTMEPTMGPTMPMAFTVAALDKENASSPLAASTPRSYCPPKSPAAASPIPSAISAIASAAPAHASRLSPARRSTPPPAHAHSTTTSVRTRTRSSKSASPMQPSFIINKPAGFSAKASMSLSVSASASKKAAFKNSMPPSSTREHRSHLRTRSSPSKSSSSNTQPGAARRDGHPRIRLPLRLPRAPIQPTSDPYDDLAGHLRRHGMNAEADDFEQASVPVDYVLQMYLATASGGEEGLLHQTSQLLRNHVSAVQTQLQKATDAGLDVPAHFELEVDALDAMAEASGATPTHVFAVHSTVPASFSSGDDARRQAGLLLPVHAMVYVLQAVSLPQLVPAEPIRNADGDKTHSQLPVIPLRVPQPSFFPLVHRYLYTHNRAALLSALVPMRHIAQHIRSHSAEAGSPIPPKAAMQALAHLPTAALLNRATSIHAAWANGLAIGLLDQGYWATLNTAWDLVVGALALRKGRRLDQDLTETQSALDAASLL